MIFRVLIQGLTKEGKEGKNVTEMQKPLHEKQKLKFHMLERIKEKKSQKPVEEANLRNRIN